VPLTRQEFHTALRAAGVRSGGVVFLQADVGRVGPVACEPSREAVLDFYFAGLMEALGTDGTLCMGTAFEDYARLGTPYVREESPSARGALSEYLRTRPGAVRSMHPVVSVTGFGARAEEICGGAHFDGFSYESPWGRLHRLDALLLNIGIDAQHGGSAFNHYVEKLYGVPYQYTKLYTAPVYSGGRQVEGPFTLSVKYLHYGITNDPARINQHLVDRGLIATVPLGASVATAISCQRFVDEDIACLNRDRYFLIRTPPQFRQGEIPWDGPTGPKQSAGH
jgi:aminoglycoside 3-N-acetyltransferase